jgi:site-specific DNA-methyltransferase (adenine-specific)
MSTLFYGDNLDVLRKHVKDETVDLCYIDPPFNSKRNYNQIYNNVGDDDRAIAQAFIDIWRWDDRARAGFAEIISNEGGKFQPQLVDLIGGLHRVIKEGPLLAYLVGMSLRVVEIHRVLKPTGSFYLHCDPTAGHYLKLVLDAVFVADGGDFLNEIIWHYLKWSVSQRQFVSNHDTIFFYCKSARDQGRVFNTLFVERSPSTKARFGNAKILSSHDTRGNRLPSETKGKSDGVAMDDVWDISRVPPVKQIYPTEKPVVLLKRIIKASTNEGDVVLDPFCGCGTTIIVAEELKRQWIGVDITFQSISLILRRIEQIYGKKAFDAVKTNGVPRDMASAEALAHKKDDRVRKEFEKWAVLTYTNNRAVINEKKGADAGIDGIAYFMATAEDNAKAVFQVKSGGVGRGDIAKLRGDMSREGAALAFMITLEEPTGPMIAEAKAAGSYTHTIMGRTYDVIRIVTVQEIIEQGIRLDMPMSWEVVKKSKAHATAEQISLLDQIVGPDKDSEQ